MLTVSSFDTENPNEVAHLSKSLVQMESYFIISISNPGLDEMLFLVIVQITDANEHKRNYIYLHFNL